MIKRSRTYRLQPTNDDGLPMLDISDHNDEGLPMLAPAKKKENPLINSAVSSAISGISSLFSGGQSQSSIKGITQKNITPQQQQAATVRQITTDYVPSDEDLTKESIQRINDYGPIKSDDPIGELSTSIQSQKSALNTATKDKPITPDDAKEFAVLNRQENLIKNNTFQTGEDAEDYIKKFTRTPTIDHIPIDELKNMAGNNVTKQVAVDRYAKLRNVEQAFDFGKRTLQDASLHYAAANGDESVKYLLDNYQKIPDAVKGEKVMQFVMNPDVQHLADKYPALKNEVNETIANLPVEHPEYAVKIMAQMIANKREQNGLNNSFANVVGKESTDKIMDELLGNGDLPPNYRGLYAKEIRPKLGTAQSIGRGIGNAIPVLNKAINEAPIPTPGLLENIETGAEQFETGASKSIVKLMGLDPRTEAQKTYSELQKEYTTPQFEPQGTAHKISMYGGQMIPFVAGTVLGGEALQAANIVKSPEVAQAAMMVLATHGDNADKALTLFPGNKLKQGVYTGTMDALNGVLGKFLPGQQIPKLLRGGEPIIADALKAMVDGKITTDAAKSKILSFVGNTFKGSLRGAEFTAAMAGADDLLSQTLQGKGIDFSKTLDKSWEAAKTGFFASGPLASMESALKTNTGLRDQMISMAANPEPYKQLVEQQAQTDPELAKVKDDILGNLDYAGKVYAETNLPEKERQNFTLNSLQERVNLQKAENATDPTIKKQYLQQAKDIHDIKNAALKGIPEEKVKDNQATRDVKELYDQGYLGKGSMGMLESKKTDEGEPKFDESKVKDYLKFVAQQSNNINEKGEFNTESDVRKSAQKAYPSKLIDTANEMFPEFKKIADDADFEKTKTKEEIQSNVLEGEKPKVRVTAQQLQERQPSEVRQRYLDDFNIVENSAFDWRVKSELSTADRKKSVEDIKAGKDTAAARKLEQEIKDTQERGTVIVNRGRGTQAQTVEIPIDEWFQFTPIEHEKAFKTADKMDDFTASVIRDNDITLQNIDDLKHLFNGFPYEPSEFQKVKDYLSGQGKGSVETSKTGESGQPQKAEAVTNETTQVPKQAEATGAATSAPNKNISAAEKKSVLERPLEEVSIDDILNEIKGLSGEEDISKAVKEGNGKAIGDFVSKAKAVVEKLYPNAKVEVYNTTKEYEDAGATKGSRGFSIYDKNGNHRVMLDLEAMGKAGSAKTAFHEAIHPIVYDKYGVNTDALKKTWNAISEQMKGVKGMDKVFSHVENYSVAKHAPEGITELLTQIAQGNIDLKDVPSQKQNVIVDLLNKLFEHLGIDYRIKSPEDFSTFAKDIKTAFEKGDVEGLKESLKGKRVDKYFSDYEKAIANEVDPERLQKLKDLLRKKIEISLASKQITEKEADEYFKKAGIDRGAEEGTGAPPKGGPEIEKALSEGNETTSIKNATTQLRREQYGLNQEIPAAKKEFGTTWDEAKDKIERGYDPQTLVDELQKKARPLTDVENAILLHHQNTKEIELMSLNDNINNAAEKGNVAEVQEFKSAKARVLDELQRLYDVNKAVGTENARGLSSRQMMVDRKYSLSNMIAEKRATANDGRPLSEEQQAEVEQLHKKIHETQTAFDEYVKKSEEEIKGLQEKILGKGVKDKKSAAQKLRDLADRLDKSAEDKTFSSIIPITPKMISSAMRLIADGLEKGGDVLKLIKDAIALIKKDNPDVDEKLLEKEINKSVINSNIIGSAGGEKAKSLKDISGLLKGTNLDRKAIQLKADNQRAKNEYDISIKKDEAKNRTKFQKGQDIFTKWQRGFKLSNPLTMGKLMSAGFTRLTTTPLEDIVGAGYSALMPKLAKGAIGEGGGLNVNETAKAYKNGLVEGIKDSYDIMRRKSHGKSNIDTVFGKSGDLPPEAIDFFGQLHSATKAPFKRFAFERSLSKRLRRNIANGVDVSDPLVQTEILTGAYKDANRAIFMQDNSVATGWQNMVRYFEKNNAKPVATGLQWLLPFVKIPTNIAAEIGTHVYGVPVGAGKLVYNAFTKGTENLTADQKDVIFRNLKKGTLGLAALTLGYMNPQVFGGFYQPGQKRKEGDAEALGLKLFGMKIPAWFVESPIFQVMQLGATVRRIKDEKVKGEEKGIGEGIWAGALGLADRVPMVDQPMRIAKLFGSKGDRQYYLGQLAKSTVDPALISYLANVTDPADENSIGQKLIAPENKRRPTSMLEYIKSGIPGLREQVPMKPETFSKEDKERPAFKKVIEYWKLELPETSPKSEKITDEENATKKYLSDYPEETQKKYLKVHNDNLEEELQNIFDNGSVYIKKYKKPDGTIEHEVHLKPPKGEYDEKDIKDLNDDERKQVLNTAQGNATTKTKKQIFNSD